MTLWRTVAKLWCH